MKTVIKAILFLILLPSSVRSQSLLFEHLNVKDGLSQSTVNSIYQDESDEIWIGTKDGLNRFNGNKFEVFRPVKGDTTGLFGNNIQTVCGNKKGKIFVQCLWGLVEYNLTTQEFKTITNKDIVKIAYGLENLWVCHTNSILKYDESSSKLKSYYKFNNNIRITAIHESASNKLYIGSNNQGLILLDKNKKSRILIADIDVVCMYEDSRKNIWVGTLDSGLYRIDVLGNITNYRNDKNNAYSLSSNYVRAVCEDNLGNYWIGTASGLNKLNSSTNQFTVFEHYEGIPYSLGSSSIWAIKKDKQGTLWIGTYFGGIDIFNPEFSFYKYYWAGPNGLSSSVIGKMTEDKEGNLWICTEGGGLNYLNRQTNKIVAYKNSSATNSISSNILKTIWYDKEKDYLWIGTHLGGLNRFDIKTKTFKRYTALNNNYPGLSDIRSMVHHHNKLYLGTKNSVIVFDIETETVQPLVDNEKYSLKSKQIWNMMIDKEERLWFSTSFAIFCYNIKEQSVKTYLHEEKNSASISRNYQNTFFQDAKGRIWLGSAGSGLDLYNPKTDGFISFNTTNSDIIDDYIVDINESKMGYLLIATNKGLSRFDVANKKFFNYSNSNIFPFTAINERGLYVNKEGKIFIGGIDGMIEMDEQDFNFLNKKYNISFSDLWVNNQRISPADKTNILEKSILFTDKIILDHNHTSIQLEVFTSNYIKILKEDIYYMLEGFDSDWIHANNRNLITYTNLSPGSYTLRVKGKSQNANEASLEIIVKPAFYKTWIAYFIYFIILASVIYMLLSNYISRVKLKTSLTYSIKEKQQIEELNQSKLRFFTNISHEFRTPITLIISQAEIISQTGKVDKEVVHKLKSIGRNADKMQRLIGELLDFSKQDQGFLKLKISYQNITAFLEDIYTSFKEYALAKNIHLVFLAKQDYWLWFDAVQMEKVCYNLIHNALKYTDRDGTISINAWRTGNEVSIAIKDTGIGMDEKEHEKVFDLFYQVDQVNPSVVPSTGIGLALAKGIVDAHKGKIAVKSIKGEGCEFTVSLLVGKHHFSEEQIAVVDIENVGAKNIISEEEFVNDFEEIETEEISDKASILIVEDNQELLNILVEIFKPMYHVDTATNGKQGLEKAIETQPDLIISDVMMPLMSGTEMCHHIKVNINTCHIPVVLLTAQVTTEQTIQGLQKGADDYITKPFNTKLLITKCYNLINGRRILQAKFSKTDSAEPTLIATNSYDEELLEKAIKIIEDNLDNPELDVNFFAKEMNLGRTNLFYKIKGITGKTPNDFIMNIRLKKSLILLKNNPELTISEIAYELGFNEPAYFIKCFKKIFGSTPTQYRKEYKD